MEKGKGNNDGDLYGVLGLDNVCTHAELRHAYKNLALRWHPDRFSKASEKEAATNKFQSVQRAYSVLSDANKRLLYDVGAYDSDDDEIGMGDFLNEMVTMMDQNKSTGDESLEELQELLEELFEDDMDSFGIRMTSSSHGSCNGNSNSDTYSHDEIINNSHQIPIEVGEYEGTRRQKPKEMGEEAYCIK